MPKKNRAPFVPRDPEESVFSWKSLKAMGIDAPPYSMTMRPDREKAKVLTSSAAPTTANPTSKPAEEIQVETPEPAKTTAPSTASSAAPAKPTETFQFDFQAPVKTAAPTTANPPVAAAKPTETFQFEFAVPVETIAPTTVSHAATAKPSEQMQLDTPESAKTAAPTTASLAATATPADKMQLSTPEPIKTAAPAPSTSPPRRRTLSEIIASAQHPPGPPPPRTKQWGLVIMPSEPIPPFPSGRPRKLKPRRDGEVLVLMGPITLSNMPSNPSDDLTAGYDLTGLWGVGITRAVFGNDLVEFMDLKGHKLRIAGPYLNSERMQIGCVECRSHNLCCSQGNPCRECIRRKKACYWAWRPPFLKEEEEEEEEEFDEEEVRLTMLEQEEIRKMGGKVFDV